MDGPDGARPGQAEVNICKQRHSPTAMVELQFEAELTRFGNLARPEMMPEVR
jgi:replicative DNA helicase